MRPARFTAMYSFVIAGVFIIPGFVVVNPNESKVLTFFGKYVGTVKKTASFG
jgi:regulator of protease activity HflC (stomatin/prohibitin superfamily)